MWVVVKMGGAVVHFRTFGIQGVLGRGQKIITAVFLKKQQ